jgi:hypothetical protein
LGYNSIIYSLLLLCELAVLEAYIQGRIAAAKEQFHYWDSRLLFAIPVVWYVIFAKEGVERSLLLELP